VFQFHHDEDVFLINKEKVSNLSEILKGRFAVLAKVKAIYLSKRFLYIFQIYKKPKLFKEVWALFSKQMYFSLYKIL
jgi:hypothetical protein